ncbi:hypothetical protein ACFXTO_006514 [Malus domestica]
MASIQLTYNPIPNPQKFENWGNRKRSFLAFPIFLENLDVQKKHVRAHCSHTSTNIPKLPSIFHHYRPISISSLLAPQNPNPKIPKRFVVFANKGNELKHDSNSEEREEEKGKEGIESNGGGGDCWVDNPVEIGDVLPDDAVLLPVRSATSSRVVITNGNVLDKGRK